MLVTVKPLKFIGTSREDLRGFSEDARRSAGFELRSVQNGMEPGDWKPMPSIGPGVNEIRIQAHGAWRAIYVARFRQAVYVLHAFLKMTRKTSRQDIALARQRYRMIGGIK